MRKDNKDKTVKQASRLTSALLARKGTASPAHTTLSLHQPVINRFATPQDEMEATRKAAIQYSEESHIPTQDQTPTVENECPLEGAIETVKELTNRQKGIPSDNGIVTEKSSGKKAVTVRKEKVSSTKSVSLKSAKKTVTQKRIAMTLRMEEESHLRLRIFSAHTRKSCQEILSEALEFYLEDKGDQIPVRKVAAQHR